MALWIMLAAEIPLNHAELSSLQVGMPDGTVVRTPSRFLRGRDDFKLLLIMPDRQCGAKIEMITGANPDDPCMLGKADTQEEARPYRGVSTILFLNLVGLLADRVGYKSTAVNCCATGSYVWSHFFRVNHAGRYKLHRHVHDMQNDLTMVRHHIPGWKYAEAEKAIKSIQYGNPYALRELLDLNVTITADPNDARDMANKRLCRVIERTGGHPTVPLSLYLLFLRQWSGIMDITSGSQDRKRLEQRVAGYTQFNRSLDFKAA